MSRKSRKEQRQRQKMQLIIVTLMAVLISMAAILIGIASMNEGDGHDHDHDHEAKVNLKVATSASEGDVDFESLKQFKNEVEEKSNGEIEVIVYDSSKLGTDLEMIDALKNGLTNVDIVVTGVENFAHIDERMGISNLPFLFDGYESAWTFMEGDIQEKIEQDLIDQNIRILAHYSDGFEYMTTTNDIMKTASDMRGKRFVLDSENTSNRALSILGVNVINATQKDLLPMIASGQFDGYAGTLQSIFSSNIQMHQKYLLVTYHSYHAQAFAISNKVWDDMTEEQQKIVKEAAESSAFSNRKNVQGEELGIIKHLETAGMRVVNADYESFESVMKSYIVSQESIYGDLVQDIMKYRDE